MNAILQAALNNGSSLQGATLFCTTFPCHSCARHIVAAGISKVYYIEPYEKSMAIELHRDSIDLEPDEPEQPAQKVIFQNFEGVAPIQYINLFQERKRKSNGELIVQKMKENPPVTAQFLDTYREYESKVVSNLHEIGLSEKVVDLFDEGSV